MVLSRPGRPRKWSAWAWVMKMWENVKPVPKRMI